MLMVVFKFSFYLNQVYVDIKDSQTIVEEFISYFNLNQVYVEMKVCQIILGCFLFYYD